MLFFSLSLRVSKPQDESPPRCCAQTLDTSDTARSVKVNPLPILSNRRRCLGKYPLTVLQTPRVQSPLAHQLAHNFSLCAPRLARPLLSCHPSCPDAPRCPLVAIQLFIFLFLPPPPSSVGMCRVYDSWEIRGSRFQASPPNLRIPLCLCDVPLLRIVS